MTQYHVSKGLKVFGKDGIAAVDKELRELVMHDVMGPLDPDKMKWKDKKEVLQYLMFLTKKQCRRLKATLDVPNAFMQADMVNLVNTKIEGSMTELLVKIKPALYRKHLRMEKGNLVLCLPEEGAIWHHESSPALLGEFI
eukprot:8935912-Ditylum_brightwellii.AAC.1